MKYAIEEQLNALVLQKLMHNHALLTGYILKNLLHRLNKSISLV
jgi:hypothetical protein